MNLYSTCLDKAVEVSEKIEKVGAGIAQIKAIGEKYNHLSWVQGIKKAPKSDIKKLQKQQNGQMGTLSYCNYS